MRKAILRKRKMRVALCNNRIANSVASTKISSIKSEMN